MRSIKIIRNSLSTTELQLGVEYKKCEGFRIRNTKILSTNRVAILLMFKSYVQTTKILSTNRVALFAQLCPTTFVRD